MARRRFRGGGDEPFPEPDILPLMNISFMLILALVTMSAMLPLGFLSSNAQKLAAGGRAAAPQKEEKTPLNLIVFITESGFNVSVKGNLRMGEGQDPSDPKKKAPYIPKVQSGQGEMVFDYATLHSKLEEIKQMDLEEDKMTITADPEIVFDVIIQTMDETRFTKEKKVLFPAVSFAAGIVG